MTREQVQAAARLQNPPGIELPPSEKLSGELVALNREKATFVNDAQKSALVTDANIPSRALANTSRSTLHTAPAGRRF